MKIQKNNRLWRLKTWKSTVSFLCLIIIFAPTVSLFAADASSTSYVVQDGSFGNGNSMNSGSFSVSGSFAQPNFGSYVSSALPLLPGNITSCGKIISSGVYALSADLIGISGTCFIVAANDVTIEGAGHTITAGAGNTSYAITATSTSNGGSGYSNLSIQNITFRNFGAGVNANGNPGTLSGGNGGSLTIASSTLGSIVASGGNASSGMGGSGGSISISGTNLDLSGITISANQGTGAINGSAGSITVNGSVLVANGQSWSGNDSAWLGSRTWNFTGNAYSTGTTTGTTTFGATSYNAGTVTGDAVFLAYAASSSGVVDVSGISNFLGSGRVTGNLIDSQGLNITGWNFRNGSTLQGAVVGDSVFGDTSYIKTSGLVVGNATFNDASYNGGVVSLMSTFNNISYNAGTTTDAVFTANSFNSVSGIPNGDPTGISSGHSVLGTITFSATTSVTFTINVGATWRADTTSWVFATPGQNWILSFGTNAGTLSGDARFTNAYNSGRVNGNATFYTNAYNAGVTATSTFYNNSYNIGTSTVARFYNTSMNSHSPAKGKATVRCDFYDSSLPGIGSCPLGQTFYHIPYYFNNAVSTYWGDLGNWWFDALGTQPAPNFPQEGDTVYIGAHLSSGPASYIPLGSILVASPITGGGTFSANFTNAAGPAYFYSGSTNAGEVNGPFHIFGNRAFSQVNTTGTFTGDVVFHDGSWNDVTLPGNAIFYDTSYNASNGVVSGTAEFDGTNRNDGTIISVATVNAGATLSGNGTILSSVSNAGNLAGGVFNQIVTNIAGAVTGAVTNLKRMVFGGGSYVASSGLLSGDAEFNATSSNRGIVSGTSTFNEYSYNTGSTSNATFVGDFSENLSGIVSGIKMRLYTALAPQFNLFRNFADSAWTIVADNTFVKLLYTNLVDLFGRDPNTTTTLVERNGGFILRPLAPGVITSCGILGAENGSYTLGSDISNYKYDTCFVVRANGVTLDGAGHTVTASSSATSLYAVIATSTLSYDATSSAFTNLTIKNIKFNNFAHGLLARGTDVPSGIGGDGASTTIYMTTLEDVDVRGGDPDVRGGHGGDVYFETSTTTTIVADGGNTTICGAPGGNGGNVYITTDSFVGTSTNQGGYSSACPENTSYHGYRGKVVANIISQATRAAAEAVARAAAAPKGSSLSKILQQAPGLKNIFTVLPPVIRLSPLNIKPLMEFGDAIGSHMFSFVSKISDFVFAPLPKEIDPSLLPILKASGISYQKDLAKIKKQPVPIKGDYASGAFKVFIQGIPSKDSGGVFSSASRILADSYFIYDTKTYVSQMVKLEPRMKAAVMLPQASVLSVTFNGREIPVRGNSVEIAAPAKAGSYILNVGNSPFRLIVQVPEHTEKFETAVPSGGAGFFGKVVNLIKRIFSGW